jgi:hypothetical protein
MLTANANPDKRFFIDLIIRDISLEDAILDLIDNAIDSLVRTKQINLYKDFLNIEEKKQCQSLVEVKIAISPKQFIIEDNCGGISFERAEKEVFRFGHTDIHKGASLSVFGIGMKRAIFKIGRQIEIESSATDSGFSMSINADEWMNDQSTDWRIPLDKREGEKDLSKAGTKITITHLREEVSTLIENPLFQNRLNKSIQETYPFYLSNYVNIYVNGKEVPSLDLSFGESEKIKPAIETWDDGNVKATMICGLLPREEGSKWTYEKSGWYLVCNGRVIVYANKTELTGWGGGILPQFMPKHRGFLGIVFFSSEDPEELPWKTTKRDIHSESPIFIRTLKRMVSVSRAVIQLQNKMYESNDDDEPKEDYRENLKDLPGLSATETAAKRGVSQEKNEPQKFDYPPPPIRPTTTSIQFDVKIEEIARVKKRLGSPWMTNKEAGKRIFKYFLDRECPE